MAHPPPSFPSFFYSTYAGWNFFCNRAAIRVIFDTPSTNRQQLQRQEILYGTTKKNINNPTLQAVAEPGLLPCVVKPKLCSQIHIFL
jgi:hypothetical protein